MNASIPITVFLFLLLISSSCSKESTVSQKLQPTFNGFSQDLRATKVVATLDEAIPSGKNVIWCASFQSAWKALQDLAGSPIEFEALSPTATALNSANDARPWVPMDCLYVAAGQNQDGITSKILRELEIKFPGQNPPSFVGIAEDSFVVYAYIQANIRFSIPYRQNTMPLAFVDRNGNSVEVTSFGISNEDRNGYLKLRTQAKVLFNREITNREEREFAVDLCSDSTDSQLVVARLLRQPTSIGAAVAWVEKNIAESGQQLKDKSGIGSADVLLVPDFCWSISHSFSDLQGSVFKNAEFKGQSLGVAQQDIGFRLDRSGVELKSEAKMYAERISTEFVFDRPFLVYLKKRGVEMPYFAMWVDNAELMRPWQSAPQSAQR